MWPFGGRFFPGTNLQDLNLDWIIQRVRDLSRGIIAPFINSANKHWMVWDTDAETFVDSGVSAAGEGTGPQGEPGKSPIIGSNGNWYNWDPETEAYVDTGVPARAIGVPSGGAVGQALFKSGAADYVTAWQDIPNNDALLAYVASPRTSVTVPAGRYLIMRGHSTITDGLYITTQSIPANTAISAAMLSAVTSGGLNQITPVDLGGTGAGSAAGARTAFELSGARSGTFSIPARNTGVLTFGTAFSAFLLIGMSGPVDKQGLYLVGKGSGAGSVPAITTISAASGLTLTAAENTLSINNTTGGTAFFVYFCGNNALLPDIVNTP